MANNTIDIEIKNYRLKYHKPFYIAALSCSLYKWTQIKNIARRSPVSLSPERIISPCGLCDYFRGQCKDCLLFEDHPCYNLEPYASIYTICSTAEEDDGVFTDEFQSLVLSYADQLIEKLKSELGKCQ